MEMSKKQASIKIFWDIKNQKWWSCFVDDRKTFLTSELETHKQKVLKKNITFEDF